MLFLSLLLLSSLEHDLGVLLFQASERVDLIQNTKHLRCQLAEPVSLVASDCRFLFKLPEPRFVPVVVVSEKLVLVCVLEGD